MYIFEIFYSTKKIKKVHKSEKHKKKDHLSHDKSDQLMWDKLQNKLKFSAQFTCCVT